MINGAFLKKIVKDKGIKVPEIATELKVTPTAVYAWMNGEDNPKEHRVFELADYIGLSENEFDRLLGVPETKVYFRKMGLDNSENNARIRAKELAETIFKIGDGSYTVEKRFGAIQSTDCQQVAIRVREFLEVENDEPVSFSDVLKELSKFKFSIFFLPLEKLKLSIPTTRSGSKREVAYSAQSKDQYLIVVDTARSKDQILFDICHELSHLALGHSEETTEEEEKLCNLVAQELIYPRKLLEGRPDLLDVFKSAARNTYEQIIQRYRALASDFDWSPDGLSYALIEYGMIKKKSAENNILHSIKHITSNTRKPLDAVLFKDFNTEDFDLLKKFFDQEIFNNIEIYRPFIELRNAASFGNLSSRRLAEILSIDSGDAYELVKSWELEQEEAIQDDVNDSTQDTKRIVKAIN